MLILGAWTAPEKPTPLKLALLKYGGGGDWYANPTSLSNLSKYCNKELKTQIDPNYATVEVGSAEIFNYPFVHMTGHGNVVFSDMEAQNLRQYLMSGGFLHIDDNYGMDPFVRPSLKKFFRRPNSLNFRSLIRCIIKNSILRKGCPRFINTTTKHHKDSVCFIRAVW
ncbi:MAG: DUF4159 domain-containing protein [Saprospiraceae bacterium]